MTPRSSVLCTLAACLLTYSASAQAMIEVTRGGEADVFGTCMPTLMVENHSAQTIDYMQVDLLVRFRGGREAVAELKSAYRYGVLRPISPGTRATLKLNADEQFPLAAPCSDIESVRAVSAICETAGQDCSAVVRVDISR